LDIANGKFIMFCDSDDYYTSNTCELMYEAIINKPNAWVFCNICRVDENDIPLTDSNSEIAHKKFLNSPTYCTAFELSLSGSCCNKIYNHEIIRKHKIRFDETIRFAEDVPFDTPYCLKTDSKIFIASPLYFYRVVNSSLTHSYHSDHLGIYIKLFKIRLPLIKENEIADFCDIYFHYFVTLLDNTMDKRNPMSFWQKMRYNDKMMKTEEFRYCVAHASGKNDSAIFMHVVRMHNYYIYWLFQKICKLKEKFKRKPKKY
ncbi:MAG: hypothetical protein IJY88_07490, partial [Clostridia bacterium]|nr:hypothetical protein [Clostridia bacterium]